MITVQGRVRNGMLRIANAFLSAVLPVAKAPVRPERPRVLVIRADHLGDATLATAPLQAIRDTLQPSRMDIVCGPWAVPIFEGHPAVDEILPVAAPWWIIKDRVGVVARIRAWLALASFIRMIRKRKYDVGIDLRGDLRHFLSFFVLGGIPERVSSDRTGGAVLLTSCATHVDGVREVDRMFAIAATIGVPAHGRPTLANRRLTAERRSALGLPARFVAVAPRGASPNRQWPPEHVAELTRFVTARIGIPVVYLGSEVDRSHAEATGLTQRDEFINLAGATTVPELIGVLDEAELVVAIDSGPMHVAAALGKPLVALWGPGSPDMLPCSPDARVMMSPSPCECTGRTCQFVSGAGRCYRAMSGVQVFEAVEEQLERERPSAYPAPRLL